MPASDLFGKRVKIVKKRQRIIITGRVQGVGFRYYTYRKANELNLSGWVKNNPNGSVAVFIEGEKGLINDFIVQLKIGPPSASVSDIGINYTKYTAQYKKFEIR